MKQHSLYLKFLLGYLIFGVTAFIAIATLSSRLTYSYLIESRSSTLYDEANLIATSYSTLYNVGNLKLDEAYPQLEAVSTFLGAQIWVMDKNGKLLLTQRTNEMGISSRTLIRLPQEINPTAQEITLVHFPISFSVCLLPSQETIAPMAMWSFTCPLTRC